MGLYEDAMNSRPDTMVRCEAELLSGQTFIYGEMSHRSRRGFDGPLSPREFGTIMARMANMAKQSPKLALLASRVMGKVNLYGSRAQACAAIYGEMHAVTSEPFVDHYRMAAPDGGSRSAHTHDWTLADKIIARAWCNVLTAGMQASVPGHGWVLAALAEREGIMLPTIPDTRAGL